MKTISKKEISQIPKSFDIVGDISIFNEFPKELIKKEKQVGEYICSKLKNIKVVTRKISPFSGKYRLMKLKIIYGEKRKLTKTKENNCTFLVNVEKTYFSPRLSTDRLRIAKKIKPNDRVLVMFSGVSPYPIVISKNSKAKEIYAVEANKSAHKLAQENLKLNKINNVKLFCGDVNKILPKINLKFDKILMPYPKNAIKYLDSAVSKSRKGSIIYFYDFLSKEQIDNKNYDFSKYPVRIVSINKCGQVGPRNYRVCFELKVNKFK